MNHTYKYKVILKDSDPSTPEGRATLETSLITFLELERSRVQELINSMPVTLKTDITEEEAKAFAKVLREFGALVFVEKIIPEEEQEKSRTSKAPSLDQIKSIQSNPYLIPTIGVVIVLILLSSLLRPPAPQSGILIDSNSLASMLQSQKSILNGSTKKKGKKKHVQIALSGKSFVRPVAITAEATQLNGKIINASFKIATESPGDLTPEEIIRGVESTWLEKGEITFSKMPGEDDEPNIVLFGDAKLYIIRGDLNERIVGEAILEKLPSKKKDEKKLMFKLRYKPKDQFIDDPFFVEYRDESGYSIVINQEIILSKKIEDKESPLNKLEKPLQKKAK